MTIPAITSRDLPGLSARAQSIIARLPQITAAGAPLVGIPLMPGMKPFVTWRKLLAGQVRGVRNIKARFVLDGDDREGGKLLKLHIYAEFGENGRRCVHNAMLRNLNGNGNGTWGGDYTYAYKMASEWLPEHFKWAARIRKSREMAEAAGLDGSVANGLVPAAGQVKVSPKHTRMRAKIAKVEAEIIKLSRILNGPDIPFRRGGLYHALRNRPHNPLLGARGGDDCTVTDTDWRRETVLEDRADKPRRKKLSKLASIYLARWKVMQAAGKGKGSGKAHFPWKEFYAACEVAGIPAKVTYQVAHARKGGPETPEDYLRSSGTLKAWFGMRYGLSWRETKLPWTLVRLGYGYREHWEVAMRDHIEARAEYAGVLHKAAEVRSMIEGLRAERQGYVDGLDGCGWDGLNGSDGSDGLTELAELAETPGSGGGSE